MNRSNFITKLAIFIPLVILALTSVSVVQAGKPHEVRNAPLEQVIFPWTEVSASQTNYIRPGLGQSAWEKSNEFYCPPYSIRVFIDGEEVKLLRYSWNDKDGILVGEPVHWWFFYHIFEAGYFEPWTWHNLRYEYYWYDGYGFFSYDGGMTILHRQAVAWFTPLSWFYVTA
ncbi:MAG: hypothetical protein ACFFCQ_07890 [Promethearchaeota archaeon]